MNRVGTEGRGESTWLGFFLHAVLTAFAPICDEPGRSRARATLPPARRSASPARSSARGTASGTGAATTTTARRSGSAQNDECRIDSIAQSWAVLSGAVPPRFAERAMDGVRTFLMSRAAQVLLLLHPPFDVSAQDPGYIKGYPPGIRENGGQYTHAAAWIVMALARLGSGDEAAEVFHMLNPVNHARDAADVARYQTRALRARRRRLQPPGASRPRRLELVHGIGGLDVSRRRREHSRPAPRGHDVRRGSVHSLGVARVSDHLAIPRDAVQHLGVESERRCRGVLSATLDGAPVNPLAIPSSTTAGCTTSLSCLERRSTV